MPEEQLGPGYRRALPVPPLISVDVDDRAARLRQALQDPDQQWLLQEFDGRVFQARGTVRGPSARTAFLAAGPPEVAAGPPEVAAGPPEVAAGPPEVAAG